MDNRSYLHNHGVGWRPQTGASDAIVPYLWKLAALLGGSLVLDDFMQPLPRVTITDPTQVRKYYEDCIHGLVDRAAMIAAQTLPDRDPKLKLKLLELQQKQEVLKAKLKGPSDTIHHQLWEGVQMMLQQMEPAMNPPKPGEVPRHILPNGAELRASHKLAEDLGSPLVLPEGMATAKFPQPRQPKNDDPGHQETFDDDAPDDL